MEKKFIVNQKTLFNILSSMQPICSKRTALDTTSDILFQAGNKELIIKSTDLEISLQASCELEESNITDPISFLVSGKRIYEIVKELDNNIIFIITESQLLIQSGLVNLSLNIKSSEEFPPFPERIENLMHFDSKLLQKMLDGVAFLIPQNNANPALNGLLLEISNNNLTMTTTDGHCLAQVKTDKVTLPENKTWLLPKRAIFELKKILDNSKDSFIFLGTCGNQLVFSGELFNFFTKLLTDAFPQYQAILDKKDFIPAYIERSNFIKTLRRTTCLLSGQFIATSFRFTESEVTVSLANKEVGKLKEEIPLQSSTQTDLELRFYSPYLLSGLQAFNENDIKFYLKNSSKPIIFESELEDYRMTYLVMPVSLNN